MGIYDDRPYDVGKGKPPKEHRWKPGQSGNPRGPKRKANRDAATMTELLADILHEKVEITVKDKRVKVTKKELILLGTVHDAASGTPTQRLRAFKALLELDAFNLKPADKQDTPEQQEARIHAVIEVLAEHARKDGYEC